MNTQVQRSQPYTSLPTWIDSYLLRTFAILRQEPKSQSPNPEVSPLDLPLHQFAVPTIERHQFFMSTKFDYAPRIHHCDLVGALDG